MLNQIYAIFIKDLKILFRDRTGIVMLFLMPTMFILVMSVALSNTFSMGSSDQPMELVVINLDEGELAGEAIADMKAVDGIDIIDSVKGVTLTRATAEDLIVSGDYPVALVFPHNFSEQIYAAATDSETEAAVVTFIVDPTTGTQFLGPIQGTVEGFIQKLAAYAQAPLQMEAGFEQLVEEVPAQQAGFVTQISEAFMERLNDDGGLENGGSLGITFEQSAPEAFVITEFPSSVEQNVPGYTIFGMFFIVQVLATSILSEKQEGTFRRLLVAPLSRPALLMGKLLPYYFVNIIQVASMFAVGYFVFDMNLGNSFAALMLVSMATAAAATGMGLLVAALGKTPEQVGGISTLLALTLAAIGGMMVPIFVMPEFMQTLSKASPHAWALAGYQDVIVRGLGVAAVMNEVSVLLGFASVFFLFAVWRFRFE